jgi:type III secretory pathway lipoprotein EscJ
MVETLRNSYARLSRQFGELTAGARLSIALLAGLLLLSSWLMLPQGQDQGEYLFGGREFSNQELAAMEQAFANASLEESEIVAYRMRIPSGEKSRYLAALKGVFEPKTLHSDVDAVLANKDWWGSSQLRELRLKNADEKDLSRTIAMMPGIEEAKISIDESTPHGFQQTRERTALAAVKPIGNMELASRTAESIRDVVSARYAGLKRDAVTVIDLNTGNIVSSASPEGSGYIPDDPYAIRKRYYEREWRSKIQDMLSMIPGVKVQVNVRLEAAMTIPNQRDPVSDGSKLVPIQGIASIAIPQGYYRMIYRKRQQDAGFAKPTEPTASELNLIEQEVTTAVRQMITGLLPNIPAGSDPYPQVQVSTYLDIPLGGMDNIVVAEPTTHWTSQYWRELTMGCLVLLALTVLALRMLRSPPAADLLADRQLIEQEDVRSDSQPNSPSLRNELTQLAQDQPEAMADTLTQWLKDAA